MALHRDVRWLVATLAIPAPLGYITHRYEKAAAAKQAAEARTVAAREAAEARLRLYTELLSRREEAETAVRKGVFDKVIETYFKPGSKEVDQKLVALELLSLNFDESLNLSPLFWQLDREIREFPGITAARKRELLEQLDRIASGIKDRQLAILEVAGARQDGNIDFQEDGSIRIDEEHPSILDGDLSFSDPDPSAAKRTVTRHFTVEAAEHDALRRRVLVRAQIDRPGQTVHQWVVWIDPYDFPFVDFTRLSSTERFSAVLRRHKPDSAVITLIYFPSARSGVKDKPFMDELIAQLRRDESEVARDGAPAFR